MQWMGLLGFLFCAGRLISRAIHTDRRNESTVLA